MKKQLNLVSEFHKKFLVPISNQPTLIPKDRSEHRYKMLQEEIAEYKNGVETNNLENIAKELADILFVTYGTILEHGLQDKIAEIFAEVHKSNISKDFHQYKMVKGKNYQKADVAKVLKNAK